MIKLTGEVEAAYIEIFECDEKIPRYQKDHEEAAKLVHMEENTSYVQDAIDALVSLKTAIETKHNAIEKLRKASDDNITIGSNDIVVVGRRKTGFGSLSATEAYIGEMNEMDVLQKKFHMEDWYHYPAEFNSFVTSTVEPVMEEDQDD